MTIGGTAAAFTAFVVAAMVIALLMFGLAAAIATAQTHLVDALKVRVVQVKRWGGWILILVGTWLIALAIWAATFARIFPV